ncbi:MAG: lysylphosphatidylglycerol synthase domain-containing protein [bacterium]
MTTGPAGRVWRIAVVCALLIAAALYMASAFAHSPVRVRDVEWFAHPWLLAAAIALQSVQLTLGCRVWWMLLRRTGSVELSAWEHWTIWAVTNPTRYIPGRIWHVASIGVLMRSAGVSAITLLTSITVHMWLFVLAACVVGLGLLPATAWPVPSRVAVSVVVLVGVLAGTHPRPLRAVIAFVGRMTKQPELEWRGSWRTGLGFVAMDVGIHVLAGGTLYLLLHATLGMSLASAPRVVAANAVSFLAGYVSLVPAGIGVREAAMTFFLSTTEPAGRAALAAIVIRIGSTATEFLLAFIALATFARRRPAARA